MFENIKQKIFGNKKVIINVLFIFLLYLFFYENVSAYDSVTTTEKMKSNLIDVFSWGATITSTLLGLMTYLVTLFLSPEWTSGSIFNMSKYFHNIWIFVSNIVYFAFAFILIFIAFANIFGIGGNFELKQALPKFIVGIFIVPFSWFLVQFLVSLSTILTIGAMNLPFEVFQNYNSKIGSVEIPRDCEINLSGLSKSEGTGNNSSQPQSNKIFDCGEEKVPLSVLLKTDSQSDGIFGIISLYTYGIVNIEGVDKISSENLGKNISTLGDVLVKIIFDLLFVIVYSLLMIALGLALMVRGIRLWIYMMLSPLFGLMYFFGKNSGGGSQFFEKFNIKELLSLVMVPVYTMLALSFGLLFIWITGQGLSGKEGDSSSSSFTIQNDKLVISGGSKENPVSLKISGAAAGLQDLPNFMKTAGNGALGIIGILILKIFGVVVLWGTFMAALNSSNITKTIVQPISDFGNQVGKTVGSLPQYIPIAPGGLTPKGLSQIPTTINQELESSSITKSRNFIKNNLGIQDGNGVEIINELKKLNTQAQVSKNVYDKDIVVDKLLEIARNNKDWHNNNSLKIEMENSLKNVFDLKNATLKDNNDLAKKLSDAYQNNSTGKYNSRKTQADFLNIINNSAPIPSGNNPNLPKNDNATNIANSRAQNVNGQSDNSTNDNTNSGDIDNSLDSDSNNSN